MCHIRRARDSLSKHSKSERGSGRSQKRIFLYVGVSWTQLTSGSSESESGGVTNANATGPDASAEKSPAPCRDKEPGFLSRMLPLPKAWLAPLSGTTSCTFAIWVTAFKLNALLGMLISNAGEPAIMSAQVPPNAIDNSPPRRCPPFRLPSDSS